MIKSIKLKKEKSCYKGETILDTNNKNVVLIYGLNGTGKSTIASYLHSFPECSNFSDCSINPNLDMQIEEILVYNKQFIEETFYTENNIKGIFTLSKENKEAKTKIDSANKFLEQLYKQQKEAEEKRKKEDEQWNKKVEGFQNKIWEIKRQYSGGDRVLQYCLQGVQSSKENLFNHLLNMKKPTIEPTKTIEELKNEVNNLNKQNAVEIPRIPLMVFNGEPIEKYTIFGEVITGNKGSKVSELIDNLANADWVKDGLSYLNLNTNQCPFCQQGITSKIIEDLKGYFDKTYNDILQNLTNLKDKYKEGVENTQKIDTFDNISILNRFKKDYEIAFNKFMNVIRNNLLRMEEKCKSPGTKVVIESHQELLDRLNEIISNANKIIEEYNTKLQNKQQEIEHIKDTFWEIQRFKYDQTVSLYTTTLNSHKQAINEIEHEYKEYTTQIQEQKGIITSEQKNVINIDEAIENINALLLDLGITDFKIIKHEEEGLYRITRGDQTEEEIFKSLSEGEKMIISFLYFTEQCKGRKLANDAIKKRIIVIDDPVSSLSHIHVFNVGRLIKERFYPTFQRNNDGGLDIKNRCEQVFILTHSLYFFYEMTEMNREKRHASQTLIRLYKDRQGSHIKSMSYEEIQSDYQAYWSIIKNRDSAPALIANCMRNIIEYFFNFVEKRDLNNTFNSEKLKDIRFQAFNRYINRESHSFGQNIYDFKEFNYDNFLEAFRLLFEIEGYETHYKKMMK